MAKHQQLYELWKKSKLMKGKKRPESSRALEARMAALEAKQTTVATRAYLQTKSPKIMTEIIKPLTEWEAEPDRATQNLHS